MKCKSNGDCLDSFNKDKLQRKRKSKLTLLSVIGGRTTVFSRMRITIFHSSFSSRFRTVFSHDCAYSDSEPAKRTTQLFNYHPSEKFASLRMLMRMNKTSPGRERERLSNGEVCNPPEPAVRQVAYPRILANIICRRREKNNYVRWRDGANLASRQTDNRRFKCLFS